MAEVLLVLLLSFDIKAEITTTSDNNGDLNGDSIITNNHSRRESRFDNNDTEESDEDNGGLNNKDSDTWEAIAITKATMDIDNGGSVKRMTNITTN